MLFTAVNVPFLVQSYMQSVTGKLLLQTCITASFASASLCVQLEVKLVMEPEVKLEMVCYHVYLSCTV